MIEIPYDYIFAKMDISKRMLKKHGFEIVLPDRFTLGVQKKGEERISKYFRSGQIVNLKEALEKTRDKRVLLYWYNLDQKITFPVGVPKSVDAESKKGYRFVVTVTLDVEKILDSQYPRREIKMYDDDAKCTLLSEYYVEEAGRPNGLSVFFRESICSRLKSRKDIPFVPRKVLSPFAKEGTEIEVGPIVENDVLPNGANEGEGI